MTLCPNCGYPAYLLAHAGTVDFWQCKGSPPTPGQEVPEHEAGCLKMFTRPHQTTSGSVNGRECVEAAGEIDKP